MIDIIILSCAALVCQMAILRLWLSSELTYPLINWLLKHKEATTRKNPLWYVYAASTCWQCLGVWVSLALVFYFSYIHFKGIPWDTIPALCCLSLGISLMSEYFNYKFLSELPVYEEEDNGSSLPDGVESTPEVNEEVSEEVVQEGDVMQKTEAESDGYDGVDNHEGP